MKIRTKLTLSFAAIGLAALAMSIFAERPIHAKLSALGNLHAPALLQIQRIDADLKGAVEESFAYVISGSEREKAEFLAWERSFSKDIEEFSKLLDRMELSQSQVRTEDGLLKAIIEGQGKLADAARKMFDEY